jgi:hypothetical protein
MQREKLWNDPAFKIRIFVTTYKIMVAFCTLTMMAALFGTAAAQIEIDSTSMTLVETLSPSPL